MHDASYDYTVYVGDNENYIAKAQTYSRDNALRIALALSAQFPDFPIVIEEWGFIFSPNFLESGIFKGEVISFPAINRKEAA